MTILGARILVGVFLLFSVLYLPWEVAAAIALVGVAYFSWFWEAVALMLLSDLLYGASEARFWGITFVSFIISTIVLVSAEGLKKKLKFYP